MNRLLIPMLSLPLILRGCGAGGFMGHLNTNRAPEVDLLVRLLQKEVSTSGSDAPCSITMVLAEGARDDIFQLLVKHEVITGGGYSTFTLPCLTIQQNLSSPLDAKASIPTPYEVTSSPPNVPASPHHVLGSLQSLRRRARCSNIVYFSSSKEDLRHFCHVAAARPLIGANSSLVMVSPLQESRALGALRGCWTFEEWGAPLLLMGEKGQSSVWVHRRYSPRGPVTKRLPLLPADPVEGDSLLDVFPLPFSSFHGAVVNITALEYPPFWSMRPHGPASWRADDIVSADGPSSASIEGADGELLKTVAKTLNLSFRILPTSSWDEAASLVSSHESLLTSVEHYVYPERRLRHDFTDVYYVSTMAFSLAVPRLRHGWTSLLRPFQGHVWLAVLATTVVVPLPLLLISRLPQPISELDSSHAGRKQTSPHEPSQKVNSMTSYFSSLFLLLRPLLNQGLQPHPSSALVPRLVLGAWLVFSFIVSTAFTTTLVASLTLPLPPPRPETLHQLVTADHRLTMPPYGDTLKGFLSSSSLPEFRQLGERIDIVSSIEEGLRAATEGQSAQLEDRMYLSYVIADQFTSASGASALYVAREGLFPGYMAWPIPFAAPYKQALSRVMRATVEAGLYQKWYGDVLRSLGRQKRRRHSETNPSNPFSSRGRGNETRTPDQCPRVVIFEDGATSGPVALNVRHLLSAVAVLLMGWTAALLAFACELVTAGACRRLPAAHHNRPTIL